MDFENRLGSLKSKADVFIQDYLNEIKVAADRPALAQLFKAMCYSLEAGGQRLRPVLACLTAEALGHGADEVIALGAAVELIHTYSLIHDDLPCMDDDDVRRGKPSNHKVFGEAIAVLAGDALNTEAFRLLAHKYSADPRLATDLIAELAMAAGSFGMVGGQAADVIFRDRQADEAEVEFLHMYKTGALFRMSVMGAARICGANAFQLKVLSDYARAFGFVFQIADDIMDGDRDGEPSYVKAVGEEKARATCQQLVARGQQVIEPFGERAEGLRQLIAHLYERVGA